MSATLKRSRSAPESNSQTSSRCRILIAEPLGFSQKAVDILRAAGDVELRQCDRLQLHAAFQEYDVVWFRLAHRIDGSVLGSAPRCRILATPVTGLDHVDLNRCEQLGIRVISLRGETGFLNQVRATAELTIGLTLALLRRIPAASESVRQGNWNRDEFCGSELFGKTAGIVGMGRLGTIVAGYYRAFGMDVIGYDPRADFPHSAARRASSLNELLDSAHVISLHVAYDSQTHHMIGADEFNVMRDGAVVINTSRGGVVDERAMLEALESGKLGGVALDVLEGELNISADHPLIVVARDHQNVIVVPHIGGKTVESCEKTEVFLATKVAETLNM